MYARLRATTQEWAAGKGAGMPSKCGFYWWRGTRTGPWQVVEVFEQDGQLIVARCARWACWPLCKRGGEWGLRIPEPSSSACWSAMRQASAAIGTACIAALPAWVCARRRTDPQGSYLPGPSHQCLADPDLPPGASLSADADLLSHQSPRTPGTGEGDSIPRCTGRDPRAGT